MSVKAWWIALSAVGVVNICAWILAGVMPLRRATGDPAYATRRRQLLLSAPFVFGCAFRSLFPRADVQKICLVDSWLSSVAVGRTVATIAEVFLRGAVRIAVACSPSTRVPVALGISRVMVPLIVMAETFSWCCGGDNQLPGQHAGGVDLGSGVHLDDRGSHHGAAALQGSLRAFVGQAIWICAGYVVFMFTIDVPMYFARWRSDTAAGSHYLPLAGESVTRQRAGW